MPLILKEILSKKKNRAELPRRKKIFMQTNWTKKKIHPLKFVYPPPPPLAVISNGPPLSDVCMRKTR